MAVGNFVFDFFFFAFNFVLLYYIERPNSFYCI